MKKFSKDMYQVDVLKVEVPFNIHYVEGYTKDEVAYTQEDIIKLFKEQG